MFIVTIVNFFAVFLTFIGRQQKKEKKFFLGAIIILILFYSIRGEYGNDLPGYIETFERISSFSYGDVTGENGEWLEPGWVALNFIFSPFGWQFFLFFLTVIQFGTVYWFITKYVSAKYYWIVFSVYVLSSNLLLTDLSMLRQALAMHMVCWTISWILKKSFFKSALVILISTTIHTSAIVAFILLTIPYFSKFNSKILVSIYIVLFIFLSIAEILVGHIFKMIFALESLENYQVYEDGDKSNGSGLGVIINLFITGWITLRYSQTYEKKFFNTVLCVAMLCVPFVDVIPMVGRISMYFILISIPSYQNLAKNHKFGISAILLIIIFIISIRGYFGFFESPIWKPYFSVYKTIFE